jgi:phosphoribosylformylglycinamidine synthase
VLGICNGFQVLARLGLLGPVSLVANVSGRFECRWVPLEVASSEAYAEGRPEIKPCLFLDGLEYLELPIAHGEGRVVVPEEALAEILPRAPLRYRQNPNGSVADIAGICNAAGNVLGLMPHPERYVTPSHHPRHLAQAPAGLAIFRNAVRYVREDL